MLLIVMVNISTWKCHDFAFLKCILLYFHHYFWYAFFCSHFPSVPTRVNQLMLKVDAVLKANGRHTQYWFKMSFSSTLYDVSTSLWVRWFDFHCVGFLWSLGKLFWSLLKFRCVTVRGFSFLIRFFFPSTNFCKCLCKPMTCLCLSCTLFMCVHLCHWVNGGSWPR